MTATLNDGRHCAAGYAAEDEQEDQREQDAEKYRQAVTEKAPGVETGKDPDGV
jgi:hypothetical protein